MKEMKFHSIADKNNRNRSNNVTAIFPQVQGDGTLTPRLRENADTQVVIHIFGQNILQNDLLKNYFEKHSDFPGRWITHYKIEFLQQTDNEETQVVLVDCFGVSIDEIWLRHGDILKLDITQHKIILINLPNPYDRHFEQDAIRKGIKGVFYQGETADIVLKGIEKILEGELWFSRKTTSKMLSEKSAAINTDKYILTAREREILRYIASGDGNGEIAEKCCISLNTVKTHICHIYKKIGVRNRLEATLWTAKYQ